MFRFNTTTALTAMVMTAAALMAPTSAQAIAVTLDNSIITVERPLSGTTRVDFTGRISLTDGYEFSLLSYSPLYNESGNSLALSLFPDMSFGLDGVLFSLVVSASDAPGSYAFAEPGVSPASITFFECPIPGGRCNGATVNYALNVVAASAPEPGTFALFGLGVLSLAFLQRRVKSSAMI